VEGCEQPELVPKEGSGAVLLTSSQSTLLTPYTLSSGLFPIILSHYKIFKKLWGVKNENILCGLLGLLEESFKVIFG
jgi:hypothetical protein